MKSILYQLQKYNPTPDNIKLTVPEPPPVAEREDDLWKLACRIVNPQYDRRDEMWRSAVKRVANLLVDMPESPFGDALFSREILGIYHCYYRHQTQVASEECTDGFFLAFLRQVDPVEYQRRFEEAVDETAKKLAVVRIALATSEQNSISVYKSRTTCSTGTVYSDFPVGSTKKEDRLPLEFREVALKYLGLPQVSAAANFQERLTKQATLDQIILGRMGYMMFWSWNNRGGLSDIPLLAAPHRALPPEIICLPAPEKP